MKQITFILVFFLLWALAAQARQETHARYITFPVERVACSNADDCIVYANLGKGNWHIDQEREGVIYGRYVSATPDRNTKLGTVSIIEITGQSAKLKVSLVGEIAPVDKDWVQLIINAPTYEEPGVVYDLASFGIQIENMKEQPLFLREEVILNYSHKIEEKVLAEGLKLIKEYAKKNADSLKAAMIAEGLFAKQSVYEAMNGMTERDVRSLLRYIKAVPLAFINNAVPLPKMAQIWLTTGSLLSYDDMSETLISITDPGENSKARKRYSIYFTEEAIKSWEEKASAAKTAGNFKKAS